MKAFFLLALAFGAVISSPCTDIKPQSSDDCLRVFSPDSICCMSKIVIDGNAEVSCVDKDISYSGKSEFEETYIKGKSTKTYLTCTIKVDFCGSITAEKANECLANTLPNGLCCFDHKQGVCFSYPYHFKSDTMICEKTEEKPEDKKPEEKKDPTVEPEKKKKKKKWWPFWA